jgi:hypothetical protein
MPKTSALERSDSYRYAIDREISRGSTQQYAFDTISKLLEVGEVRLKNQQMLDFKTFQIHFKKRREWNDVQLPWSFERAYSESHPIAMRAAALMPVYLASLEYNHGLYHVLTWEEAERADMILLAVPDIPPRWARWLAWRYVIRVREKAQTETLDMLLAYKVWRSEEDCQRFIDNMPYSWVLDEQPDIAVLDAIMIEAVRSGRELLYIRNKVVERKYDGGDIYGWRPPPR